MKILVPVDGSRESLAAVRHALQLVRSGLKASLLLANVQEPAGLYELLRVHDAEAIEQIAREAGEHLLAEAVALCSAAGVDHEIEVARGEPIHALLADRRRRPRQGRERGPAPGLGGPCAVARRRAASDGGARRRVSGQ